MCGSEEWEFVVLTFFVYGVVSSYVVCGDCGVYAGDDGVVKVRKTWRTSILYRAYRELMVYYAATSTKQDNTIVDTTYLSTITSCFAPPKHGPKYHDISGFIQA